METNYPFLRTLLSDFVGFMKKPDDVQLPVGRLKKLHILAIFLVLELIITIVAILPLLSLLQDTLELDFTELEFDNFYIEAAIIVIAGPFAEELIFRYFLRYKGLKTKIIKQRYWNRAFPYLVYVSAITFGMVHAANYSNNSNLFYVLSPLIVLSQLIGGLILSYIRVRLNFIWGVLFHATWNLIIVSLSYLP